MSGVHGDRETGERPCGAPMRGRRSVSTSALLLPHHEVAVRRGAKPHRDARAVGRLLRPLDVRTSCRRRRSLMRSVLARTPYSVSTTDRSVSSTKYGGARRRSGSRDRRRRRRPHAHVRRHAAPVPGAAARRAHRRVDLDLEVAVEPHAHEAALAPVSGTTVPGRKNHLYVPLGTGRPMTTRSVSPSTSATSLVDPARRRRSPCPPAASARRTSQSGRSPCPARVSASESGSEAPSAVARRQPHRRAGRLKDNCEGGARRVRTGVGATSSERGPRPGRYPGARPETPRWAALGLRRAASPSGSPRPCPPQPTEDRPPSREPSGPAPRGGRRH